MKKLMIVTAMAAVVLTACASDSGSPTGGDEPLPTGPTDSSSTTIVNPPQEPGEVSEPGGETGSEIDEMVDAAIADLADLLSVDTDAITVVTAESVTWRDGSMGCPEPGMSYTQALVDGVRIELMVDGSSHWYHQGGSNPVRHCDDPQEPLEVSPDV